MSVLLTYVESHPLLPIQPVMYDNMPQCTVTVTVCTRRLSAQKN